jgi:hypothetical protein
VDLSNENGGSVHGFWLTFTRPGMSGDSDLITEHVLANQWRAMPILKNDGVRQWGWDDIPYMKWNIKHVQKTTNQGN